MNTPETKPEPIKISNILMEWCQRIIRHPTHMHKGYFRSNKVPQSIIDKIQRHEVVHFESLTSRHIIIRAIQVAFEKNGIKINDS